MLNENKIRHLFNLSEKKADRFPEQKIREVLEINTELRRQTFYSLSGKYRTDYIVWDTKKDMRWNFMEDPLFQEVKKIDDFVVYKIL